MRQCKLDAIVATSPVAVQYFTDYYWWLDPLTKEFMSNPGASGELLPLFAVYPLEGEPALVVNPLLAVNAADIWVRDIHVYGKAGVDWSAAPRTLSPELQRFSKLLNEPSPNATPLDAFLEIIRERGLSEGRIGVELEGLSPARQAALRERLPRAAIRDCTNLIRLIRAVKSQEEIERLRRAAEISERAAMTCFLEARAGDRVSHLVQLYRTALAQDGAAFDHFAYAPKGLGIAIEGDYVFERGDALYMDFGCVYQQYFSDSGLTLSLGEPSREVTERYNALRACIEAGVAAARVGIKASQVQRAMVETLASFGPWVSFPHGHALGLEVRDYPIFVPANNLRIRDDCIDIPSDLPLEQDMVFNLEASIFQAGVDSLNIEQTFIVTANGSEPLFPQARIHPFDPDTALY